MLIMPTRVTVAVFNPKSVSRDSSETEDSVTEEVMDSCLPETLPHPQSHTGPSSPDQHESADSAQPSTSGVTRRRHPQSHTGPSSPDQHESAQPSTSGVTRRLSDYGTYINLIKDSSEEEADDDFLNAIRASIIDQT